MALKTCRITNCPSFNGICQKENKPCEEVTCLLKTMLEKPHNRINYIKNKLSSCYGYSEQQKQIRYEELVWVIKEFGRILDVEVLVDGNWKLVEKPL